MDNSACTDNSAERGDEDGAVAVVVAILLIVLLGISAFAVDFGLSYTSSQALQSASDGASLAAASSYGDEQVSCVGGTLAVTGGARSLADMESDASDDAVEVMEANHPVATETPGSLTVGCESGAGDITTERDSAAAMSVPTPWSTDCGPTRCARTTSRPDRCPVGPR